MKTYRDISQKQFDRACQQHGFKPIGFLGYFDIGNGCSISAMNGGRTRRSMLAYLLQQRDRLQKER